MTAIDDLQGHRQRLRQRFLTDPSEFDDLQLLELLLTYAIPRQDVAPLAASLIGRFGSLLGVLNASLADLTSMTGIGKHSATLIKLVAMVANAAGGDTKVMPVSAGAQAPLFEVEPDLGPLFSQTDHQDDEPQPLRAFANEEIANSLEFMPLAARFQNWEHFKTHLQEHLPYNSASTRHRRANYILGRFLPKERLDVPLVYFAEQCGSRNDLKPVIFYHILQAEPLATLVAEELIWPSLPLGKVERDDLREFVLRFLPDISAASQAKVLRALFNSYDLLSIGRRDGDTLRFQIHKGTLESFLYVLTAEFPEPGMYSFELLEQGPLRRWLLWDKEWMHSQLYNLRDLGILSKVSQIDTVRQFTLPYGQWEALRAYFEHPQRGQLALRDRSNANEGA